MIGDLRWLAASAQATSSMAACRQTCATEKQRRWRGGKTALRNH